ncbi:MAG: CRTAC1 family protein, partial [Balneolaceae bacterium]
MAKGGLCLVVLLFAGSLFSCSRSPDLQWQDEDGYRQADLPHGFLAAYLDEPGFERRLPEETGLDFRNDVPEAMIAGNQNLLNGSGVATGDVDGDGLVDLYLARLDGPNILYKNLGGFRFRDITGEADVAHEGWLSTGAVLSDLDGDGDPDLLVTALDGGNALYLNDGTGRFTLKADSGLEPGNGSTTAALADIDGDGDLDLYITRYKERFARDIFGPGALAFENTVEQTGDTFRLKPPFDEHLVLFPGEPGELPGTGELGIEDQLYLNNGDGSFQKATDLEERFLDADENPLGLAKDWGLTAKFQDMNGDGWPDLYVCNDYWTPDRVWINRGDGTFRALGEEAIRNMSFSSMAVDFADLNKDGLTDLFVTEMLDMQYQRRARQVSANMDPYTDRLDQTGYQPQYMRNSLYIGRADGTFSETGYYSGVAASGWSWAVRFLDVDLDGHEDLIVSTGYGYDVLDLDTQMGIARRADGSGSILDFPQLLLPNVIFRNNGDLTFSNKGDDWGFTEEDVSQGLATADFDNDGDLDLVLNRFNEEAAVFENRTTASRIAVRLRGRVPNTAAIGARVSLSGGPADQMKELASGGDYLSGSDPLLVFAADASHDRHLLSVTWPDGSVTEIDGVVPDHLYEIEQPAAGAVSAGQSGLSAAAGSGRQTDSGRPATSTPEQSTSGQEQAAEQSPEDSNTGVPAIPSPLFEDISDRVSHTHHEDPFQDGRVQPLLPWYKSRSGPGVSWLDVTG